MNSLSSAITGEEKTLPPVLNVHATPARLSGPRESKYPEWMVSFLKNLDVCLELVLQDASKVRATINMLLRIGMTDWFTFLFDR
jgi:hypothetical protein